MQPVPLVTAADVERIVRRDFPLDKYEFVRTSLNEYGSEGWHHEKVRVQLAILKLAAGRLDQLRSHLEMAKQDYRDVLAYAEYPQYMRAVPPSEKIESPRREQIIGQDWTEYQEWLQKK
jgi:hypothetical protein